MKKIVSILLSVCLLAGIFTSMPTSYFAAKKKAQRVSLKKKSVTIKIIESENNIAYGITSVKIKKAKGVTIKKITYKSTNKKIAKVNKKGVVTAVKKGTAKIKAIVKYKFKKRNYTKKLTLKVKVKHEKGLIAEPASEVPETTAPATAEPSEPEATTEPSAPVDDTQAATQEPAPTDGKETTPPETAEDTQSVTEQEPTVFTEPETTKPADVTEPESETTAATVPATEEVTKSYDEIIARSTPLATAPALSGNTASNINDEDYIKKLSAFSNRLYEMSAEGNNSNYTMSPISVYMALSLLYYSGDDDVKADIEKATGMTADDIKKTGALFKSLLNEKTYKDKIVTKLSLTNSIWCDEGEEFNADALKNLAETLYCDAYKTPFSTDNAAANKAVREYIKKNTNGKIDQDFALTPDTFFALINTLYFKDIWSVEKEMTVFKKDFITSNGKKNVDFIKGEYHEGQVQENKLCEYFYTTTNAGYKVKFILPKEGCTLKQAMSAENLNAVNAEKDFGAVDEKNNEHYTRCVFPLFKIKSDTPLKDIFESNKLLGHAFLSFSSDLTDKKLFVSDIKHKSVVEVNKEGIEGAAVTIICIEKASMPMQTQQYHTFTLDRSFGFIITDPSDVVLFTGQVTEP